MGNVLTKTQKKAYTKSIRSFPASEKKINIYSSIPFAERKKSTLIQSLIDSSVKTYPKTPPGSDAKLLVGTLLGSSKASTLPSNFIKNLLDEYPSVGMEVARNPFLSFSDRFYALRNSGGFFKLLLIAASTEATREDLESACKEQNTVYPLNVVSDIVFNDTASLEFFYKKDMYSVAASANISQAMVDTILENANTRVRKHRICLAELASNPWVSIESRKKIIQKLFNKNSRKKQSAHKIALSIPYIETHISRKNFNKFFKNLHNNPMGLYSWANGNYTIQNILYKEGTGFTKINISEAIANSGLLATELPLTKQHPAGFTSIDYVKVNSETSEESQKFITEYINDDRYSLLEKVAAVFVYDENASSLNKLSNSSHPSFPNLSSYSLSLGVAACIFLRSTLTSTQEWECFASLIQPFEDQLFYLIDTIKKL